MDVHSKKQRSYNMSRIRSKNSKPEVLICKILKDLKIPFSQHVQDFPGHPDIYIPSLNLVIEIYGCFWHGHNGCQYFVMPESNVEFWKAKIQKNVSRDKKVQKELDQIGLQICLLWECEIKDGNFFEKLLNVLC